jgi:hypothetical protein
VTVIVEVTAELVVFVAVNAAIVGPAPLAAKPMEVVLLVQGNELPVTEPVKVTAVVLVLLHTVWLVTALTVGVGLTVAVYDREVPLQELAIGVTVIVPEI